MKHLLVTVVIFAFAYGQVERELAHNCHARGNTSDGLYVLQECHYDCLYFGADLGCVSNGTQYCLEHPCPDTKHALVVTTSEKRLKSMEQVDLNLSHFHYDFCLENEPVQILSTPIKDRKKCVRCLQKQSQEGVVIDINLECKNLKALASTFMPKALVIETYALTVGDNAASPIFFDAVVAPLSAALFADHKFIDSFNYSEHFDLGKEIFTQLFVVQMK